MNETVTLHLTKSNYKALMDLTAKHDPSSRLYSALQDSLEENVPNAPDALKSSFIAFRQDLRQLLFNCGVFSNPGWTEDNIVNAFRGLLVDHTITWKTPVNMEFNRKSLYMGSDALKAYQMTGLIRSVILDIKGSGDITVKDADDKLVFSESYRNGKIEHEYMG